MRKNTIVSEKEFIESLFNKWYKIPNYQRPYVWDVDNVIKLLDDLSEVMYQQDEYFLGSLVVKNSVESIDGVEYENLDLLDGQQRITTLFLIYSVVKGMTKEEGLKKACISKLHQEKDIYSGKPNRVRIEFDIRDDVNKFIDEYVVKQDIVDILEDLENISKNEKKKYNISIANMAENMLVIYNYFTENDTDLGSFIKFLNLNVSLIYVGSSNFDDAFKLFTVMNSRGIALRNSDILKAQNLAEVPKEQQRYYAIKWESIENYFEEDFDTFLSYIRTLLVKQRAKTSLLKEFEDVVYGKGLLSRGIETFEYIEKYKEVYEELFETSHLTTTGNYKLDNILFYMKEGFEADYWVTAVMRYFEKFKYEGLIEFIELFDAKFSFDWITKVYATRRIDNVNEIIRAIEESTNSEDVLNHDLLTISESDKDTLENIISSDVYGSRFARYLLLKLDYLYSSNDMPAQRSTFLSIEHILPRNPKEDSQWSKDFTDDERETMTNKLGNLILLSRRKNSTLSNRDFKIKKETYFKKNIETFPRSIMIMNNGNWSPRTLDQSQKDSVEKIMDDYR